MADLLLKNIASHSSSSFQSSFGSTDELNRQTIKDLSKGDLVKFHRKVYFHWAVYLGHELVAHLVTNIEQHDKSEQCNCEIGGTDTIEVSDDKETNLDVTGASDEKDELLSMTGASYAKETPTVMTKACDVKEKAYCPKCKKRYSTTYGRICFQNIRDVIDGCIVQRADDHDHKKTPLTPDEICQRACRMYGQANYHLMKMNCEHFATWCRYGYAMSSQTLVFWDDGDDFKQALKRNCPVSGPIPTFF